MSFIYDTLDGDWPLLPGSGPRPPIIADIRVAGGFTSARLTQVSAERGRMTVVVVLTHPVGVEDVEFTATAKAISVRPDTAYPLVGDDGVVWGRVVTGTDVSWQGTVADSLPLDPRVIFTTGYGDTMVPGEWDEIERYTFSGSDGITMVLDQTTNVVSFGVDRAAYSLTSTQASEVAITVDAGNGIEMIGPVRGSSVALAIQGMTFSVHASPHALVFTYTGDLWSGCPDTTIYEDNISCSSRDGSSVQYPLDRYFCDADAPPCSYAWETQT